MRRDDTSERAGRWCRAAAAVAVGVLAVALSGAAAQEEAPVTVRLSVDTSGESARVLVTHSREIAHAISRAPGRLEIVYADPIRVDPPAGRVGDPILEGWIAEGDRVLLFRLGPRFQGYERFELKHPFRIVLDLLGAGQGTTRLEAPPTKLQRTVVVIDPGHGGVERGAVGPTGLEEKEIALHLARELKVLLEQDPEISVVLTRNGDEYVPLEERTAVANYNRANLFLSIHLNASRRKAAYGAETYYLSTEATDNEARTLAALENRAYVPGGSPEPSLEGRQNPALELILWDLAQNQYLAESSRLAEAVQKQLNALVGTRDRGVRQAPFTVLMGATMPAILVEVGFITNASEEAKFRGLTYRSRIVDAMGRAVMEYLRGVRRTSSPGTLAGSGTAGP